MNEPVWITRWEKFVEERRSKFLIERSRIMNKNYLIKRKHKEELLGFKRRVELSEIREEMTYGELTVGLKLVAARNGVGGFEPEERRFLVFLLHLELENGDSVNVVFVLQVEVNFSVQNKRNDEAQQQKEIVDEEG
jgi:hypothetical protein